MPNRPRRRVGTEYLVGTHEVAELLGVSRQRVHQLSQTRDFPSPIAELAAGLIWRGADVEQWRDEMRTMRRHDQDGGGPKPPERDPERPQDDPWDANAIRYLLDKPEGRQWTRGNLMECMREQGNRMKRQPGKVREAAALARMYGVERHPDPGANTIHFFRTDDEAPLLYPASAAERRAWLRETL